MLFWLIKVWLMSNNGVFGIAISTTAVSPEEIFVKITTTVKTTTTTATTIVAPIETTLETKIEKTKLETKTKLEKFDEKKFEQDEEKLEEELDNHHRLVLLVIATSCIGLAVLIIGAGLCFYKKYGASHYGSGHIRILSEDGSVEEEVMYIFQTDGKLRRESSEVQYKFIPKGKNLGYFYADPQGNIISSRSGIVNNLACHRLTKEIFKEPIPQMNSTLNSTSATNAPSVASDSGISTSSTDQTTAGGA